MAVVFPSGKGPDGNAVYYVENDLKVISKSNSKTSVSINRLPVSSTPLMLEPSEDYRGAAVMWERRETPNCYKCLHRPKLLDDKFGDQCLIQMKVGMYTNINSLRTHSQTHWKRVVSVTIQQIEGQSVIGSFFGKVSKVQNNTAISKENAANHGSTIDVDDSVAHGESAVIPTHVSSCEGILYSDVTSIFFPPTYDFLRCYPIGIHSPVVQEQFKEYNGFQKPKWNFNSSGMLFSNRCDQSVYSETSSFAGKNVCLPCLNLMSHPHLLQVLAQSATSKYHDRLPDALSPAIIVHTRKENGIVLLGQLRLESFNQGRKIGIKEKRNNDNDRLIFAIQSRDVPQLRRLLVSHLDGNRNISSFIERMNRASDYLTVGHSSYTRQMVSKGKRNESNGTFDDEYLRQLDLSYLMCKMGGSLLAKAGNSSIGTLSKSTVNRRINDGTLPNLRIRFTHGINEQGCEAIRLNVQDTFANEVF